MTKFNFKDSDKKLKKVKPKKLKVIIKGGRPTHIKGEPVKLSAKLNKEAVYLVDKVIPDHPDVTSRSHFIELAILAYIKSAKVSTYKKPKPKGKGRPTHIKGEPVQLILKVNKETAYLIKKTLPDYPNIISRSHFIELAVLDYIK